MRELYFGDEEGVHFDSLPSDYKDKLNSIEYRAKNGESWMDVRNRSIEFFKTLP
jgi:broad specificity phosphatase PhoE